MSDHIRVEQDAASWLARRGDEGWTEEDEDSLRRWLEKSWAHKAAFWRLDHGYSQLNRLPGSQDASPQVPGLSYKSPTYLPRFALAASVMAGMWACYALYVHSDASPDSVRYSTVGEQTGTLALNDGSVLDLNINTQVRFIQSDHERGVWLDRGEVYFEVAPDRHRPFTVHVGSDIVTVLGTKFSVARSKNGLTIAVLKGQVSLRRPGRGAGSQTILSLGYTALANDRGTSVTISDPQDIDDALAWHRGLIVFNDATLRQAAESFNKYNRKKLILMDPAAANLRIGGTFKIRNVDGFARLLADAYGLKTETVGEDLEISSR